MRRIVLLSGRILLTGLFLIYLSRLDNLIIKYHEVDTMQLYKVDTFHLFTRAFETPSGHDRVIAFRSTNGYYFSISGNVFFAISNRKKLEDTLMYHDIKFTVFTNKRNFEQYKKGSRGIKVYQIQIGNTRYINLDWLKSNAKKDRVSGMIVPLLFIFFFVPPFFYKDFSWWTERRMLIWGGSYIIVAFCIQFVAAFSV